MERRELAELSQRRRCSLGERGGKETGCLFEKAGFSQSGNCSKAEAIVPAHHAPCVCLALPGSQTPLLGWGTWISPDDTASLCFKGLFSTLEVENECQKYYLTVSQIVF